MVKSQCLHVAVRDMSSQSCLFVAAAVECLETCTKSPSALFLVKTSVIIVNEGFWGNMLCDTDEIV